MELNLSPEDYKIIAAELRAAQIGINEKLKGFTYGEIERGFLEFRVEQITDLLMKIDLDNLTEPNLPEAAQQPQPQPEEKYLILSGEGNHQTENQFLMESSNLQEANKLFDCFKSDIYKHTYLYIFKATLIREE